MLGRLLFFAKDWKDAIVQFEYAKACEARSSSDDVGFNHERMYLLGSAYARVGKFNEAAKILMALLEEDDEYIDAYFELAFMAYQRDTAPKSGIELINKYFKLINDGSCVNKRSLVTFHTTNLRHKAYFCLGAMYHKIGDIDKAKEAFDSAVKLQADYIAPYLGLAKISVGENDLSKAKELYYKVVGLQKGIFVAHFELAGILMKERKYDYAKQELAKCLEISEDNLDVFSMLGTIHEESGDFDKAERCYKAIVDRQPQNKSAIIKVGDILMKKNDLKAAQKLFKDLLAMSPSYVPANISVGNVLLKMDDTDAAEAHFGGLMDKYPDVAEYVLFASKIALHKMNYGDALKYFDRLEEMGGKYKKYIDDEKGRLKEKGII